MKMIVVGAAVFALVAGSASAQTKLICKNPFREYLVVYSPGAKEIILSPDSHDTRYPILVDDMTDGAHIITATTPNGGPTARLHLRPYQKMEFWSDGEVDQTDGCYRVN